MKSREDEGEGGGREGGRGGKEGGEEGREGGREGGRKKKIERGSTHLCNEVCFDLAGMTDMRSPAEINE